MRRLAPAVALAAVLAACGGPATPSETATIVVNVPLTRAAAVAEQIVNGATLAAEQINARGGVDVGGTRVRLAVETLDSDLSPARSLDNVREAIRRGAVAVIDEGTGVEASWRVAADAGLPIAIVHQGSLGLVDPEERPNVFRIAPTDRGAAFRLAEYLVPKGLRLALLTDDSAYGAGGAEALKLAFASNPGSVTATIGVPAAATDVAPQVLRARQSGATGLLVWARPAVVALAVRAARASGWDVPLFAPTAASDPLVRRQLADRPQWLDGLTFTMSRLTAEKGPEFFERFRAAYEGRFGAQEVGVRSGGKEVVQPPDWAMYPYDFVNVLAAAMERARARTHGGAIIAGLNDVEVLGANGDERAFNVKNHEGVVDDDIFFARFRDMIWRPVDDDPLSASLVDIPQTR